MVQSRLGGIPSQEKLDQSDRLAHFHARSAKRLTRCGGSAASTPFVASGNDPRAERAKWTGRRLQWAANQADVRRIALSLPQTEEAVDRFAFSVRTKGKLKGFVWVWMERIEPKKPRVPQPDVIAVRVASLAEKDRHTRLGPNKSTSHPEPPLQWVSRHSYETCPR